MIQGRPSITVLLALMVAGCDRRPDDVPVAVSVAGAMPAPNEAGAGIMAESTRVLTGALAQGLVRFDAVGEIEPGLAERWIVTDEGRSYIFRLRVAQWPDGNPVTAQQVVASLRRTIAARSGSPLAPFLAVVDEIVEMTPQVIEVRLTRPRPDLLKLFAQPELAVVRAIDRAGTGPFRTNDGPDGWIALRPSEDLASEVDPEAAPRAEDTVLIRGERMASAVARFAARESDLVLGGSFRDWPLLDHAGIAPANRRVDPAVGLFGFAIVSRDGFLSLPENREAMAMAIDRPALTALFRPEWQPVETVFPARLDSATDPTPPRWQALSWEERRNAARNRVAAWRSANSADPPTVRIALPPGPGSTLLWARLARDFIDIGLVPERVSEKDDADLRLIDAVAPYDSGRWYLVTACRQCPAQLADVIAAARDAPTLSERSQRIAAAELAMAEDGAYIPIAQPLRWSLVALRLAAWQDNARAWHPLTHLRQPQP